MKKNTAETPLRNREGVSICRGTAVHREIYEYLFSEVQYEHQQFFQQKSSPAAVYRSR